LIVADLVDPSGAIIYQFPGPEKLEKLSATEEAGSTPSPTPSNAIGEVKESPRGFLQVSRRALSEEELSTPAARRFLIFEIERLDQQCSDYQGYAEKYHDQRVLIAALEENQKTSRWNEILSFVCLTVGAAGLGSAPSYLSIQNTSNFGWIILVLSMVLVGVGVASRVWK
jgi:hypothetical protein